MQGKVIVEQIFHKPVTLNNGPGYNSRGTQRASNRKIFVILHLPSRFS